MKQVHIYYEGDVQGVGFRYTCYQFANQLNLKGWVKNVPDGRVELIAQGEKELLNQYIEQIDQEYKTQISTQNIAWEDALDNFPDFSISQ